MERGAGGGAGERALEQVFKQRVSGDACLNRGSRRSGLQVTGGANPGRALEQVFGGARNPGTEGEGWPETGHRTAHTCMMTKQ